MPIEIPTMKNEYWNGDMLHLVIDLAVIRGHEKCAHTDRFYKKSLHSHSRPLIDAISYIERMEDVFNGIKSSLLALRNTDRVKEWIVDYEVNDWEPDRNLCIIATGIPKAELGRFDSDERFQRMETFENHIKRFEKNHMRILSNKNVFIAMSSTDLTPNSIAKLKKMSWNLTERPIPGRLEELFDAVINLDAEKLEEVIRYYINHPKLKTIELDNLRAVLDGNGRRRRTIASELVDIKVSISNYEDYLIVKYKELQTKMEQLAGIQDAITDEEWEDTVKYITKHPYLDTIKKLDKDTIQTFFIAPIEYYDIDAIDNLKRNKPNDTAPWILLDILQKGKYQLWTYAGIRAYLESFTVTHDTFKIDDSYVEHPHIGRYNCFGNFPTYLREAMKCGNYIGLIEQMCQAVQNLNLYDSIVFSELVRNIANHADLKTFVNTETNERVSFREIVKEEGYTW